VVVVVVDVVEGALLVLFFGKVFCGTAQGCIDDEDDASGDGDREDEVDDICSGDSLFSKVGDSE